MAPHQFFLEKVMVLKLVLLVVLVAPGAVPEYGHSILSLVRPNASLMMSTLPFLNEPNVINLENFPYHTTLLPIADGGRTSVKSEEIIEKLGKESLSNTVPFVVTPPKGYGMMVVIQELQIPASNTFNRSLLVIAENGKIKKCFSKLEIQIEGQPSVTVCGRTHNQGEFRPSVLDGEGPRTVIVPEGKTVSVRFIYRDHEIDSSPSLTKQVPYYDVGYTFRASIAFTAFRQCPHGPLYFDENNTKLWPCNIPRSDREPVAACVREEVFCDNVINCGIHDIEEFALDEKFCVDRVNNYSISRENQSKMLDVRRLEETIRGRFMNQRPYGYEDMLLQMSGPVNYPSGHDSGGLTTEPTEKYSTISHPAFVALVVLISIICVLVIGVLLRFCCRSCVGKMDQYGESSNPEAVARFHENLRSRDVDATGRPRTGYGISRDNLFKPTDDFPPSYDDLFPEGMRKNCDTTNPTALNDQSNAPAVIMTRMTEYSNTSGNATSPPTIYTVPIQPSCTIIPNSTAIFTTNENAYVNPGFIHIEAYSPEGSSRDINDRSYNQNHPRIDV